MKYTLLSISSSSPYLAPWKHVEWKKTEIIIKICVSIIYLPFLDKHWVLILCFIICPYLSLSWKRYSSCWNIFNDHMVSEYLWLILATLLSVLWQNIEFRLKIISSHNTKNRASLFSDTNISASLNWAIIALKIQTTNHKMIILEKLLNL